MKFHHVQKILRHYITIKTGFTDIDNTRDVDFTTICSIWAIKCLVFFIIYIFMQLNVWFLNVNVQFLPTSKIPIFHYFEETREITFINLYWPLFYYKVKTSSYLINWKIKIWIFLVLIFYIYIWCLNFLFFFLLFI